VNPFDVLKDHRSVLHGLCQKISAAPVGSARRQKYMEELLIELDIHMRIGDDIYSAMAAAGKPIMLVRATHRRFFNQLATLLHTPPTRPTYEDEWESFETAFAVHADEEERHRVLPPVDFRGVDLDTLGNHMQARMQKLRCRELTARAATAGMTDDLTSRPPGRRPARRLQR
jgi:hypothetical protein